MRGVGSGLAIWLLLACTVGWAEPIEVSPSGSIPTIEAALTLAQDGDTILIHPGVYRENGLKIERPVTLRGVGDPVVDGEFKGTILSVSAPDVTIEGLTLINVGRSYTSEFAAIYLSHSDRFTIRNNTLEKAYFGLHVERSKSGLIEGNHISGEALEETDAGNGVHLWRCSGISIRDNVLQGLRDGIYLEFVDDSEVSANTSSDNLRYGLHFMFSDHNNYTNNTFKNNGAGVAVMFSKFIEMRNNRFSHNWGASSYGLLLKEIYDAEVIDNEFEQNSTGIQADGSTRINYLGNRFLRNGWAVKISGACYTNAFHTNSFEHNTFDLSYHGQLHDNSFDGNYWSDYTGYDLDRDGVGDVPYRPVKLFSYIVNRTPETIILLRSLFVDLINFSEKVSPVFTPDNLLDNAPLMKGPVS